MNCKYCNKEYLSLNALKQHECRCKNNPHRLVINHKGWPKGKRREKSSTKGTICVTNGYNEKYIVPELLKEYENQGWYRGRCISLIEKMKNNSINTGKAKTVELEKQRKEKISKSMKNNDLCGGYRLGSGRGHKGWYNNIYCDSSWELAMVCYYIEHNMNIKRCKEKRTYIFNGETHSYYPDFITDTGIIEIKGFTTEQWKAKNLQNPDIKVLYHKDVKVYLDYVIEKYGETFWKILYNK